MSPVRSFTSTAVSSSLGLLIRCRHRATKQAGEPSMSTAPRATGQHALITGGGRASAPSPPGFSCRGRVALLDRDGAASEGMAKEIGDGSARGYRGDVTDSAVIDAVLEDMGRGLGRSRRPRQQCRCLGSRAFAGSDLGAMAVCLRCQPPGAHRDLQLPPSAAWRGASPRSWSRARVNAVSPGTIDTPIVARFLVEHGPAYIDTTPMRRLGQSRMSPRPHVR